MKKLHSVLQKYWPLLLFIAIYVFIFRKVFFMGLVPFPGDLLTSSFFPYNSGGWEGFTPWITHKEFILADVIRMIYPRRILSMDLLKQGIFPLWNIYAFSGYPLFANLQSAVLYPFNILFFVFKTQWAWIIYIMIQPILATFFMYLFIRTLGLSRLASIFAGIGFAFTGYTSLWFEMGTIGHAALWLPFILWGMTKYLHTKNLLFIVLSAFGITCSIFAGHPQTTSYVLIFSFAYFLYLGWDQLTKRQLIGGLLILLLGIALTAVQLIPTFELLRLSANNPESTYRIFHSYITPPQYLVTLFTPDFFGNPATNNYWGKNYGEFMNYSGIIVLLIAAIGFYSQFKNKLVRLSFIIAVIAFLIAYVPPIAELLFRSPIPVLNSELPSRIVYLASIGFVMASAYGIEAIQTFKLNKIIPPVLFILGIYIVIWIIAFTMHIDPSNVSVTKHNILLPTAIAFIAGLAILFRKYTKHFFILWIIIFACMGFEYSYFLNKYLPWSPAQYMFPQQTLITKLQQISGPDRVYGSFNAGLETNFSTQWRLQSPEGYDPLYIKSYAELMEAGNTGKLETDLPRGDALLPASLPMNDSYRKQVLLNLLGVKYLLDKPDVESQKWDPEHWKFPLTRFNLIYQQPKWKIFQNKQALPRALVFHNYEVIPNNSDAIKTIFDKHFSYNETLILANNPKISTKKISPEPAKIILYSANKVIIQTNTKTPGILFLSDNIYPGWVATVDNNSVPILRADYSFRGVEVPKSMHTIIFSYRPLSFYFGVVISFLSFLVLLIILRWKRAPKRK